MEKSRKPLCATCFFNIKPDELPLTYLPAAFCEYRIKGYPEKVECGSYSDDGIHKESDEHD